MISPRPLLLVALAIGIAVVLSACATQGSPVEVTRVVVERVEVTPDAGADQDLDSEELTPSCCETYRIRIYEDITTNNIWQYLGPESREVNALVLEPTLTSLYALSDQRFDFVPVLAADLPPEPVKEGEFWTIEVEMVEDARWSDGEPIDAQDVAFTLQTCLDLQLTGNWAASCQPGVLDHVEAVEPYKLKYFYTQKPGLGHWQYGVAQAVILPQHFWADTVNQALEIVRGVQPPGLPPEEGASEDEVAAYDASASAYKQARFLLYGADGTGHPSGGAFILEQMEPGAFVGTIPNPNYYLSGTEIIEYEDGTWKREFPNGKSIQLYGDAEGEETLRFTEGPFSTNVIFSVHTDQAASYMALAEDELDFVPSANAVGAGWIEIATGEGGVRMYRNPGNFFMYLGFNLRREIMSDLAFRQAIELLIDKELVAERVLQNTVFPLYSVVPPGNSFWHNDNIRPAGSGLTRSEQFAKAKEILSAAGYSWDTEPEWDEDGEILQRGLGLRLPDGEPMPTIVLNGPSAASIPAASSYSQWIEQWAQEFGIPLEAELSAFDLYIPKVFGEADFDMYVLGWGVTIYPDYLVDFFHSKFDSATTGNANTTGFSDPTFDSLGDQFRAETDMGKARELAHQLQAFLARELPYIPLYSSELVDMARDRVEFPYTEVLGGFPGGLQSSVKVIITD